MGSSPARHTEVQLFSANAQQWVIDFQCKFQVEQDQ